MILSKAAMDNVTEKIEGLVEILFPLDVIFEKLSIFFFGQRAVVPREILEGEHPTFACVVNCLKVADDPMVKVANVRVMDAVDDIVEEFIIESDVQLEKIINGLCIFPDLVPENGVCDGELEFAGKVVRANLRPVYDSLKSIISFNKCIFNSKSL